MREFLKNIEHTINRHEMLSGGEMVLVAFSGGPDSVCLLDVLQKLQKKYSIRLGVAHFNHRLRGEASEKDAEFAEQVAGRNKLMFISSSADVAAYAKENKLTVEDAGRKLRYEFFFRSSLSIGATKIALGHTADDQAETILMRLIRGAGPEGLAGIPPARTADERGNVRIIRPLIYTWRNDLIQYVQKQKLEYRTDVSNEEPEYFRNKVRLELLPLLMREYNAQIKRRLAATASALSIENDFLSSETRLLAGEVLLERKREWVLFDAKMLSRFHPALRARVFAHLVKLARPAPPMLEAFHYAAADALFLAGGRMNLPGDMFLELNEEVGVVASPKALSAPIKGSFPIRLSGRQYSKELNILVKTSVLPKISSPARLIRQCSRTRQYFDLKAVRAPLEIRVKKPGDIFWPLGMDGSKKLKDFFIDRKIPRFIRNQIPLLLSEGRIMWVMGYAIDKRFKLKPNSKSALRVDYEKPAPGTVP